MTFAHLTDKELVALVLSRDELSPLESELLTRLELSIDRTDDSDAMVESLIEDVDLAVRRLEGILDDLAGQPSLVRDVQEVHGMLLGLR